jgi:hypothetical protein
MSDTLDIFAVSLDAGGMLGLEEDVLGFGVWSVARLTDQVGRRYVGSYPWLWQG